ncbi:sulfate transporter family protein [Methylobrevis albus]|uniref:Sulfate transporter family protein n=1 Tax=Methylobrevis albus TaxID=2793297 RepID=A0A931MWT2_9HYPH|nr:sulfate transporter family protein [Methylobrevis albus]MBH0237773.1 sulfate transporter family protein [Methylobrevis albus]
MLQAASLAVTQIFSPPFRAVLWRALGLTIAMLAAVWATVYATFNHFVTLPWPWLQTTVEILTGVGLVIGLGFLIAPVSAMFAGLFLDDVAEAVERTYYPADPPGVPVPTGQAILSAIRFTALVITVNVLVLLLVLLPGINVIAFFFANGYLLGREYFEQAAGRFHPRETVAELRNRHAARLFFAGLGIAFILAIPIVNLLTPLFATALMVHVHKRIVGSRPMKPATESALADGGRRSP